MQILHPFSGTIQQYLEQLGDPDSFRPPECPLCDGKQALGHTDFIAAVSSMSLLTAAFGCGATCVVFAGAPCRCCPSLSCLICASVSRSLPDF